MQPQDHALDTTVARCSRKQPSRALDPATSPRRTLAPATSPPGRLLKLKRLHGRVCSRAGATSRARPQNCWLENVSSGVRASPPPPNTHTTPRCTCVCDSPPSASASGVARCQTPSPAAASGQPPGSRRRRCGKSAPWGSCTFAPSPGMRRTRADKTGSMARARIAVACAQNGRAWVGGWGSAKGGAEVFAGWWVVGYMRGGGGARRARYSMHTKQARGGGTCCIGAMGEAREGCEALVTESRRE
eukprot:153595-Chlamydomonas_euryale.AAC.1